MAWGEADNPNKGDKPATIYRTGCTRIGRTLVLPPRILLVEATHPPIGKPLGPIASATASCGYYYLCIYIYIQYRYILCS